MIKYEDGCKYLYCDKCNCEEYEIYSFKGEEFCKSCLIDKICENYTLQEVLANNINIAIDEFGADKII